MLPSSSPLQPFPPMRAPGFLKKKSPFLYAASPTLQKETILLKRKILLPFLLSFLSFFSFLLVADPHMEEVYVLSL